MFQSTKHAHYTEVTLHLVGICGCTAREGNRERHESYADIEHAAANVPEGRWWFGGVSGELEVWDTFHAPAPVLGN